MTATITTPHSTTKGGSSIAERLDRLSLTSLHIKVILLCTAGLAVDIGEVALSNTFSAIFLSPPYNAPFRCCSVPSLPAARSVLPCSDGLRTAMGDAPPCSSRSSCLSSARSRSPRVPASAG